LLGDAGHARNVKAAFARGKRRLVGKIGVSGPVLHKAGKLSDAEYRHTMEHTEIGARILGPLMRDAPGALSIVRSHHDRLDGRGFPDGLKGSAIPFRGAFDAEVVSAFFQTFAGQSALPIPTPQLQPLRLPTRAMEARRA
jgi:hypothetical protein